jgi:excinuclease ABC subunit A
MNTLSGGEVQRIRLALSLGSGLTGSIYVLDEPSIGLHVKDTEKLIKVLKNLRDRGNTVVVVEHDREIIGEADYIINLGPFAGVFGGETVVAGTYEKILRSDGITAAYLSGKRKIPVPRVRRTSRDTITLKGVRHHNLKNIDVSFPLHTLTVITGVSGSGKSSLVSETLFPAVHKKLYGHGPEAGEHDALEGAVYTLSDVEFVGQEPVGRMSRSNPATYIKVYDEIRKLMASQKRAVLYRLEPRHFSFNVPGGRCETCKGEGEITVKMQFMADVKVTCEVCGGKRFKDEVLEVRFAGKNIYDILEMSVDEAVEFFEAHGQDDISNKLKVLQEVGLGYVKLGQSTSTLSGGEAQRMKLAVYLLKGAAASPTLFIFDEPTTGLHFYDIEKLLQSFDKLIENGHSIVVIEHHPDVIKSADYIIDLGPGGGVRGGEVVFSGTPEELIRDGKSLLVPYLKT